MHRSEWENDMLSSGHLFFYLADEEGNALTLGSDNLDIHESSLLVTGSRMNVGGWQLHLKAMVIWQWFAVVKTLDLFVLVIACNQIIKWINYQPKVLCVRA